MEIKTMTYEEQEQARRERLSEVGTLPPCPFCQKPRVQRSDYIRCNPCGVNWLNGEEISKDPREERRQAMLGIPSSKTGKGTSAQPAVSTSKENDDAD